MIKLPIKLSSVPRSKLLILFFVALVILALFFGGIYYWLRVRKESSSAVGSGEYVVTQRITSYSSPGEEHGYIIPGKRFIVLEESDGWFHIRLTQGAEPWIQASETAYQLVEEE